MNQGRTSGWTGRGVPVEDPVEILKAMQDLHRLEMEFPLKVEGTHTLPYSAQIQHMDLKKGLLHIKLIRPLPHELTAGAVFDMLFPVGDMRFEAQTVFQGRENYLLYRFSIPVRMASSDRRRHKRYPFRPREKAYVIAQDGGVPGHGISGPLVNLSEGGLAFRVDRVMRLDDHMRVTPGLGFFERGKSLSMLKIRDLPNLPLFEARGVLANAWERDGEFILGVQFGELRDAELHELQFVLSIRENRQRTSGVTFTDSAKAPGPRDPSAKAPDTKGPGARVAPAGNLTPDALKQLGRRSSRLLLAMRAGPGRDQIRQALHQAGFQRLETFDTLDSALGGLRTDRNATHALLVSEVLAGEAPVPAGIRTLQQEFGEHRELPVALISLDQVLVDDGDPLIRPIPCPTLEDLSWLPLLDELAGLE